MSGPDIVFHEEIYGTVIYLKGKAEIFLQIKNGRYRTVFFTGSL